MGVQATVGAAVSARGARHALLAVALWAAGAGSAAAGDRYALVVTGASGGAPYAEQYDAWRMSFVQTLEQTFAYPKDRILVLAEKEDEDIRQANRENVRRAVDTIRRAATKDDVVLILLIGHGTSENEEAKFNLVGPDLSAREWDELLRPVAARLIFVDAASGSFPFLQQLSGRGRIVLTANDSAAQQFETVFPGFFIGAYEDAEADFDRNGKVSVWEAFTFAAGGVRRWFEERGQLATERPMLDDNGDGIGRDAETGAGSDGPLAQITYLQPDAPIVDTGDPELTRLRRRRVEVESELERLRANKTNLSADEYDAALERLLLELARIDRQLRSRS
jgi:hypothetical protein